MKIFLIEYKKTVQGAGGKVSTYQIPAKDPVHAAVRFGQIFNNNYNETLSDHKDYEVEILSISSSIWKTKHYP